MDILLISQDYRVINMIQYTHINKDNLPKFYLNGIRLDKNTSDILLFYRQFLESEFYTFFENTVYKWCECPDYKTISFVIDNTIIELDFMNNLTHYGTHPNDINNEINRVKTCIEKYYFGDDVYKKCNIPPQINSNWYNEQLCHHLNFKLQDIKMNNIVRRIKQR
jgi:hypothetical protein